MFYDCFSDEEYKEDEIVSVLVMENILSAAIVVEGPLLRRLPGDRRGGRGRGDASGSPLRAPPPAHARSPGGNGHRGFLVLSEKSRRGDRDQALMNVFGANFSTSSGA